MFKCFLHAVQHNKKLTLSLLLNSTQRQRTTLRKIPALQPWRRSPDPGCKHLWLKSLEYRQVTVNPNTNNSKKIKVSGTSRAEYISLNSEQVIPWKHPRAYGNLNVQFEVNWKWHTYFSCVVVNMLNSKLSELSHLVHFFQMKRDPPVFIQDLGQQDPCRRDSCWSGPDSGFVPKKY